jgi:hypothetical protein
LEGDEGDSKDRGKGDNRIRGRHCKHDRVLLFASMEDNETASWQDTTADLDSKIMKFGNEFHRQIFLPLRVNIEEWRH